LKKVTCNHPVRAQLSDNNGVPIIQKEFLDTFSDPTWSNDLASQLIFTILSH